MKRLRDKREPPPNVLVCIEADRGNLMKIPTRKPNDYFIFKRLVQFSTARSVRNVPNTERVTDYVSPTTSMS